MENPWVGKRIIVVEDSPMVREELVEIYQELGLQVIGVSDKGVEGLALITQAKPDIVSLDIILADMNGMELATLLQERLPEMPILFVSFLNQEGIIEEAYVGRIPKHYLLNKPLTRDDVISSLRKIYSDN